MKKLELGEVGSHRHKMKKGPCADRTQRVGGNVLVVCDTHQKVVSRYLLRIPLPPRYSTFLEPRDSVVHLLLFFMTIT